jgi:hypothetical protein
MNDTKAAIYFHEPSKQCNVSQARTYHQANPTQQKIKTAILEAPMY